MLSRSRRLTTREFAIAFDKGRVMRHPLLQLRIYRREDVNDLETRAAFVVPKKLGKAVWRNRLRRKVRERYRILSGVLAPGVLQARRETGNELQAAELRNCDLIFFINTSCQTATTAQIDEAIAQLWKRAAKSVSSN